MIAGFATVIVIAKVIVRVIAIVIARIATAIKIQIHNLTIDNGKRYAIDDTSQL